MNLLEFGNVEISPKPDAVVYRYISKIVGTEISNLSLPCQYPKLIRYISDLQNYLGVSNDDIKQFKSKIETKYKTFDIYNDKYTVLLIMAVLHFSRKKKYEIAKSFFLFLSLKFYSSRIHMHLSKFCNDGIWMLTLDRLSPRHLFKTNKGIGNAISYISDFDFNKNKSKLEDINLKDIDLVGVVYGLRTKIAQSVKSFAQLYYKLFEDGKSTSLSSEDGEEVAGTQLVADKISMTMCVFGQIDKTALSNAISQSRVRKDLAISMVSQLSNSKYKDSIRFIIILISRLDSLKNVCIESKKNKLIKKINSKVKVGGKYIIRDEIKNLLYSLESGYQLRTIYDAQLVMFFGHYLTNFLRNRIC